MAWHLIFKVVVLSQTLYGWYFFPAHFTHTATQQTGIYCCIFE